jgi:glutamine amidotransferase
MTPSPFGATRDPACAPEGLSEAEPVRDLVLAPEGLSEAERAGDPVLAPEGLSEAERAGDPVLAPEGLSEAERAGDPVVAPRGRPTGRATRRPPVALLDYGVGNLHSAAKALDRSGAEVRLVPTVEAAAGTAALVVPGVGAYGACLAGLGRAGGAEAVAAWIKGGQPVLGICVGMQMLFEGSEEGPVSDGIGAIPGTVRRLPGTVKVPHIGWNQVRIRAGSRLLAGLPGDARFYFVHSYAAEADDPAVAAVCDYGMPFAAAVERENLFGTQFHPEKSGSGGLALLANFVDEARRA